MSLFEKAKKTISKGGRQERGAVMVVALIVLLVGALMIPPTLHHIGTGTKAVTVFARQTDQVYAADAGVEYALRWLASQDYDLLPWGPEGDLNRYRELKYEDHPALLGINGHDVDVAITGLDTIPDELHDDFKIVATLAGNVTSTTSYAHITAEFSDVLNYSLYALGDGIDDLNHPDINLKGQVGTISEVEGDPADIFANGDIGIDHNVEVNGTAHYTGEIDNDGTVDGEEKVSELDVTKPYLNLSGDETGLGEIYYIKAAAAAGVEYTAADFLTAEPEAEDPIDGTKIWNSPVKITGDLHLTSDDWYQFNGGLWIDGVLSLANGVTPKIIMGNNIYVGGGDKNHPSVDCSAGGTLNIVGPYHFIAQWDIEITGNSKLLTPEEISAENMPVIASAEGNIAGTSNFGALAGIFYAPEGDFVLKSGSDLYGVAIAQTITCSGKNQITYPEGMYGSQVFPAQNAGEINVTYWKPGNY